VDNAYPYASYQLAYWYATWYDEVMSPRSTANRGRTAAATPRRVPWGTISREQVVAAATRVVKRGGYETMTIRSLATDLGVAPMSLYRHVRDKDDLLDEVVDRLLAKAWQPSASSADWQAWVAEAAEKLRSFLTDQPAALHVYLQHPVVSPAAIERMNAMMDVFRNVTVDEEVARRAYAAIHTYTLGFAALEASRSGWMPTNDESIGLAEELAGYVTPAQFSAGLRYLLEGIEREVRGTRARVGAELSRATQRRSSRQR